MKIALPKDGNLLNQHFGQSPSFLIASLEKGQVAERQEVSAEVLKHNHAGLSGLFFEQGVSLVIVGGIGGPALQALQQRGLRVIRGASGPIDEVLGKFINGQLEDQDVTCGHHDENHQHQNKHHNQ